VYSVVKSALTRSRVARPPFSEAAGWCQAGTWIGVPFPFSGLVGTFVGIRRSGRPSLRARSEGGSRSHRRMVEFKDGAPSSPRGVLGSIRESRGSFALTAQLLPSEFSDVFRFPQPSAPFGGANGSCNHARLRLRLSSSPPGVSSSDQSPFRSSTSRAERRQACARWRRRQAACCRGEGQSAAPTP
jgi:hypothetical protein